MGTEPETGAKPRVLFCTNKGLQPSQDLAWEPTLNLVQNPVGHFAPTKDFNLCGRMHENQPLNLVQTPEGHFAPTKDLAFVGTNQVSGA